MLGVDHKHRVLPAVRNFFTIPPRTEILRQLLFNVNRTIAAGICDVRTLRVCDIVVDITVMEESTFSAAAVADRSD